MKVTSRAFATFGHDIVMAALSFLLSFYLRVGNDIFHYSPSLLATYDLAFAATAAVIFRVSGLYRGIWRFASLPDLLALLRAVTLIILIFFPVMFLLTRLQEMPRSLVGINWLLLMAMLGAPRFAYRVMKDRGLDHVFESASYAPVPILLIGAREGADLFIRAIGRDPRRPYRVVGILADGSARVGRDIGGVGVLGTFAEIADVVAALTKTGNRPQRLIVCQELSRTQARQLFDFSAGAGIPLARVPRLTDFRETRNDDLQRIEPVAIEDLLGRPQTVLDRDSMRALIAGRRVLVTGAGGTIGGELSRQIASYGPAKLALLDNGEYALYSIDQEIKERFPDIPRQAIIADVRERRRIDEVMDAERPELVFHAAALKHVPMVEANPLEGLLTNVIGTRNVAEACRGHGITAMVMISTDKAVNPANVMGASKRLAESICQALDIVEARRDRGTRYITVRFGNVLGSTGSVVPLFQRQLAAGGPLTVTHPDIQRFFMTVREAVELVLQASALAGSASAARGKIFVLDMGEPVKIADLASQMIRLAGKRPDTDIKIEFVGLRPGEKLYEELFYANETLLPTKVSGIRLAAPRTSDYAMLARALDEFAEQLRDGREDRAIAMLGTLVPEFAHANQLPAHDAAERAQAREP
ncbi:MAG TPA: nucleoside-diphosphate sugar epimerase/dehydratase [Stellaceae bacterium]|jgi:O-antigen biosynthesis protein WbqV|nr:nucleoside-diphosphate sugar epimerase/dehydratase [Stellaceae bacterium]